MSQFQNKTLFTYNDIYSIKNTDKNIYCPYDTPCNPSTCNGNDNTGCDVCYKYEYCKNKTNADELRIQNEKYLGKTQEYNDTLQMYNSEYIKSINVMVGIIAILSFIFYNK